MKFGAVIYRMQREVHGCFAFVVFIIYSQRVCCNHVCLYERQIILVNYDKHSREFVCLIYVVAHDSWFRIFWKSKGERIFQFWDAEVTDQHLKTWGPTCLEKVGLPSLLNWSGQHASGLRLPFESPTEKLEVSGLRKVWQSMFKLSMLWLSPG